MVKRGSIVFHQSQTAIREPVTKFGGQPVWHTKAEWPLSRSTGRPMRFIAQIGLDEKIFGRPSGGIAYLFITDELNSDVPATWEPDGGENAVIVQPGIPTVPVIAQETGPTLYRMVKKAGQALLSEEPCEFVVEILPGEDPDFISQDIMWTLGEDARRQYREATDGNKIGGTPGFLQSDEFPIHPWKLLLQLDSTKVPFSINFGDAGIGYAFLSADNQAAKFLWQCC